MRVVWLSSVVGFVVLAACSTDLSGFSGGPEDTDGGVEAATTSTADASGKTDASPKCATFECGSVCVTPNDPAFGCSVDRNCQACGGPANGTSTCTSGKCSVKCAAPFLDCNTKVDDGCEVDPTSDPKNCGTCGHACPTATPYCVAGQCATNCPLTLCNGQCVDTQTSLADCGGCNKACAQPAGGNGTASCKAGMCAYTCAQGYADCDMSASNGCETFVNGTNVAHCGSCNACPAAPPNEVESCSAGQCRSSCASSYVDCNGASSDGCECHTVSGVICRANKTCGQCSTMGGNCTMTSDCCAGNSLRCSNGSCIFDD